MRDRETDVEAIGIQRNRHIGRHTYRQTDIQAIDRQRDRHIDIHSKIQATDRQRYRLIVRQGYRQTD